MMDNSSSICTICLDSVSENAPRSTAKLQCGHRFHLDCIGSAFNVKGAMECPNCRDVEHGRWLCPKDSTDEILDEMIADEDQFEHNYYFYQPLQPLPSIYGFHHWSDDLFLNNEILSLPASMSIPAIIDQYRSRRPSVASAVTHNSGTGTNAWTHGGRPVSVTCPLNPPLVPSAVPGVGRFDATWELPQSNPNGSLYSSEQQLQEVANDIDTQEVVYYRFSILPDTD